VISRRLVAGAWFAHGRALAFRSVVDISPDEPKIGHYVAFCLFCPHLGYQLIPKHARTSRVDSTNVPIQSYHPDMSGCHAGAAARRRFPA
jgi:hypothetical protein